MTEIEDISDIDELYSSAEDLDAYIIENNLDLNNLPEDVESVYMELKDQAAEFAYDDSDFVYDDARGYVHNSKGKNLDGAYDYAKKYYTEQGYSGVELEIYSIVFETLANRIMAESLHPTD